MDAPLLEDESSVELPSIRTMQIQDRNAVMLQRIAMLSNFSTSYNVVNISLVIPIFHTLYKSARPDEDEALLASSLLAGMMAGQLLGGVLGDLPAVGGRLGALRLVMGLQVVASLACACCQSWKTLATWRCILGIGAGGVYPLAAVLSAEQGAKDNASSIHRVVLTFSMQGLGFWSVPCLGTILLLTCDNLQLVWRLLCGLGCVPGTILLLFQFKLRTNVVRQLSSIPLDDEDSLTASVERNRWGQVVDIQSSDGHQQCHSEISQTSFASSDFNDERANPGRALRGMETETNDNDSDDEVGTVLASTAEPSAVADGMLDYSDGTGSDRGWWASVRAEPNLWQKLLGTAATWFLFDMLFYGNTLFQPIVMEAAFGGTAEEANAVALLRKAATNSLILTSIALPGYAVAAYMIGKSPVCFPSQTVRYVMLQGFAFMAILYAIIGSGWRYLKHSHPFFLVLLYGLTFFFANYGPNTTTFVLPSMMYTDRCRTTLNGISAAAGKLGAFVGATLFAPSADKLGDSAVMIICAVVAILSFLLTYFCVPSFETTAHEPTPIHEETMDEELRGELS